ncbi:MAG: hypothetical protein DHS20C18_54770 [Saprospiraceae bacterium]|nr:MAG: hypothetical protein DHS20C18_54770 [Saprospiraceae bacterium]
MSAKTSFPLVISLLLLGVSCQQISTPDYSKVPAKTASGINVVVEIPAGTNHKIEYHSESKQFLVDSIDGQVRIIDFLPYPGNYGFIPSTLMDEKRGGDGDALDVLIIGESVPTGTVVEAIPIATLRLLDRGEVDTKIIAVPADPSKQIIKSADFQSFLIEYDAAKRIIENWFLHYKGWQVIEFLGWEDEKHAWQVIEKWNLNSN